jgi:hypothetical protein
MRVLACEVVGVLAHVQRPEQHRARGLQPPDQRGVARRRGAVAVDAGSGAGGDARDVEQVLHREGHAGQRQRLARAQPRVHRLGGAAGAVHQQVGEGADPAVQRRDPGQRRLGDGGGVGAPGLDGGGNLPGGVPMRLHAAQGS